MNRGILDGASAGALLTAPLVAVSYLAWKVGGLPFAPFDIFDWMARALPGSVVTFGVDALGVKATCQNSIMCLRKQGRSLQIGLTTAAEKGEVALPIDRMVTMELQLIASLGMPANRYPSMLQMVNAKKLNPKSMITETISLGGASAVLEQMTTFQNVGVSIINKYTA